MPSFSDKSVIIEDHPTNPTNSFSSFFCLPYSSFGRYFVIFILFCLLIGTVGILIGLYYTYDEINSHQYSDNTPNKINFYETIETYEPIDTNNENLNNLFSSCLNSIKTLFPSFEKMTTNLNKDKSSFITRNMIDNNNDNIENNKNIEKCTINYDRSKRNTIKDDNSFDLIDLIDPLNNLEDFSRLKITNEQDLIRVKRKAEAEMQYLRNEFSRSCRETNGKSSIHCKNIRNKYIQLVDEVNKKMEKFASDLQFYDDDAPTALRSDDSSSEEEYDDFFKKKIKKIETTTIESSKRPITKSTMPKEIIVEIVTKSMTKQINPSIEEINIPTTEMPKKQRPIIPPVEVVVFDNNPKSLIINKFSTSTNKIQIDKYTTTTTVKSIQNRLPTDTDESPTLHNDDSKIDNLDHLLPHNAREMPEMVKLTKTHYADNFVGQTFFGDGFYYSYNDLHPRVHEELIDIHPAFYATQQMERTWNEQVKSAIRPQVVSVHDTPSQQSSQPLTTKNQEPIIAPASGPFITLCNQFKQKNNNPANCKGHWPQFQTVEEFGDGRRQDIPATGETSTSSSQLMFNQGFSFSPTPICFYPTMQNMGGQQYIGIIKQQPSPQMWATQPQSQYVGILKHNPSGYNYGPLNGGSSYQPHQYVPMTGANIHPQQQPGLHSRMFMDPVAQPVYCTYLSANNPMAFNAGTQLRNGGEQTNQNNNEDENIYNIPSESDIIYASYANRLMAFTNNSIANMQNTCDSGFISCFGTEQCIPRSKWCDSTVDCKDGSDESACSCKARLAVERICDGYLDCPMGSDEIGCFGCDKFAYSCYTNSSEYEANQRSSFLMCYTMLDKCDGIHNCPNGKDEEDCSMIVRTIGQHLSYMVSYSEGYLHRNFKGKWYPVCKNPEKWAKEACEAEVGILDEQPELIYRNGQLPSQFIQPQPTDALEIALPILTDHCTTNEHDSALLYVKCPTMRCGLRTMPMKSIPLKIRQSNNADKKRVITTSKTSTTSTTPLTSTTSTTSTTPITSTHPPPLKKPLFSKTSSTLPSATNETEEEVGNMRVVGGDACSPLDWPFLIGLYRNGRFHCGGIIHNEQWIITAAHCVAKFTSQYYEVRAGMLRRESYAPMTQTVKVLQIFAHEDYDKQDMRNDIAMLRLENNLIFNRWVKPICLPGLGRSSDKNDWIWGPAEGTICQAVGWGAIREKGPDSDNMQSVNVPIIGRCKHLQDREGEEICAGEKSGGRDACQGDSGGPLFCRSVLNQMEWYLAGVVSHGEGCARVDEPGVYTRVALFNDWINLKVNSPKMPENRPLMECPGIRCVWGGAVCISKRSRCDGVVDCLGGEDEINCSSRSNDMNPDDNDDNTFVEASSGADIPPENNTTLELQSNGSTTIMPEKLSDIQSKNNTDRKGKQLFVSTEVPFDPLPSDPTPARSTEIPFDLLPSDPTPQLEPGEGKELPIPTETRLDPLPSDPTPQLKPKKGKDLQTPTEVPFDPLPSDPTPKLKPKKGKDLQTPTEVPFDPLPSDPTPSLDPQSKTDDIHLPNIETPPLPISDNDSPMEPTKNIDDSKIPATNPIPVEGEGKHGHIIIPAKTIHKLPPLQPITPTTIEHEKLPELPNKNHLPPSIATGGGGFEIPDKFLCRKILQSINIENRCDMISDCEDGTDEENCTCREYLKVNHGHRICDGKIDCLDLSDEKDCLHCAEGEYSCLLSKQCIPMVNRCDDKFDCHLKEDELDCIALTDGTTIHFDGNLRPILKHKGIASKNTHGVWNVLCSDEIDIFNNGAETAGHICSILGFSGYSSYNVSKIIKKVIPTNIQELEIIDIKPPIKPIIPHKPISIIPHKPTQPPTPPPPPPSPPPYVYYPPDYSHSAYKRDVDEVIMPFRNNYGGVDDEDDEHPESRYQELVRTTQLCFVLNVECVPHSTIAHGGVHGHLPHQISNIGKNIPHKPVLPIKPIFQPDKKPSIFAEFNHTIIIEKPTIFTEIIEEDIHWPWAASIYVNGKLVCVGILLDKYWVLTESSCVSQVRLEFDYVVVILGGGKPYLNVPSLYEQVIRVNCIIPVDGCNTVMLYLEYKARYNRHCLPTFLPDGEISIKECLALSHSKFGKLQHLIIKQSQKLCRDSHKCFVTKLLDMKKEFIHKMKNHLHCDGDDVTHCGVVTCKSDKSGYYPVGFYTNKHGLCSFDDVWPVFSLSLFYKTIQSIIDYPKCQFYNPPICLGHRCRLGECISESKICNGKFDCHDGSDEDENMCYTRKNRECPISELKCKNGKCIPKSKFCDHYNDCGDLTDEPKECSCYTYLSATDSSKICDGMRNCWDKSDENPAFCKCKLNSFRCGSTHVCVPKDFVCDKEIDCPNGEDEKYCYGLEQPSHHNGGYAQVIEQTYGVWHTKCFPKPHEPTEDEIADICRHIGYRNVAKASGRIISDTSERSENGTIHDNSLYRQAPTKAIITNQFSPLRIHDDLTLFLKPSRPIAKLQQWTQIDIGKCFRVEVLCE